MQRVIKIFLNSIVILLVGLAGYQLYINSLSSEIDVSCSSSYSVLSHSMDLLCVVEDPDSIISEDKPLTIELLDENSILISELTLHSGNNLFEFDDLEYNSQYNIKVSGYNFDAKNYIETDFYSLDFSTANEVINIPTLSNSLLEVTDSSYEFSISVEDTDEITSLITVDLYSASDDLVSSVIFTDFTDKVVLFENLDSESDYHAEITLDYLINDYLASSSLEDEIEFTTLRTKYVPTAVISSVTNNNVTLEFTLSVDNKDATNVIYSVLLVDELDAILYQGIYPSGSVSIDVSAYSGNYDILINADYDFEGSSITDDTLTQYLIYNNQYSNFFLLDDVEIVNTDLKLSSYSDFKNYIYTYFNDGVDEFTIECISSLDCETLVTNETLSNIPFDIIDLVHSYHDITNIQYSYNSQEVTITVDYTYTSAEINNVNQEVNSILNTIVNETMTPYDKILAVHDYIINNAVYDEACLDDVNTCDNDHSAIGILFDNNAVCEGYAHTMDIMLRALNIPSFKISSDTHQWNAVYYDGGWYHLDATWDDPVTNDGSNVLRHDYFLIDTATLNTLDTSQSHTYATPYVSFME